MNKDASQKITHVIPIHVTRMKNATTPERVHMTASGDVGLRAVSTLIASNGQPVLMTVCVTRAITETCAKTLVNRIHAASTENALTRELINMTASVIRAILENPAVHQTTKQKIALASPPRAEMEHVIPTEMILAAIVTLAGTALSASLRLKMRRWRW
jgi:hypothetical protein